MFQGYLFHKNKEYYRNNVSHRNSIEMRQYDIKTDTI